jgi:hypothetical protein
VCRDDGSRVVSICRLLGHPNHAPSPLARIINCAGLMSAAPLRHTDDVEDIGRPDLEVLRASEAKNCDLLTEIGGRMDEVCEAVTRYSSIRLTPRCAINAVFVPI